VLNDFKASYFAGALLLPAGPLAADLNAFFRLSAWQGEALLGLLDRHAVTPETLMYRFSQLVPHRFGLPTHFLRFNQEGEELRLVKQLNLSRVTVPAGIGASEHYCRRWLSTRLLVELAAWQRRRPPRVRQPLVGAQHSRFPDGRAFFCFGLAQPLPLRPEVLTSLTLGFRVEEKLARTVRFVKDRTVPQTTISGTCERCSLTEEECGDRVAPPAGHLQALFRAERERALASLTAAE
jgi:hypothetical protein